jgi:alpha-tubulin suppressor-like RCC1 family protein
MGLAVGGTHTCAINSQGETYCWGANTNGQLGDGTTAGHLSGAPTAGGVLFVAITAGLNHTCGLRQSGATYCWGANGSGRLGDGTLIQRTVPVQVSLP